MGMIRKRVGVIRGSDGVQAMSLQQPVIARASYLATLASAFRHCWRFHVENAGEAVFEGVV